MRNVIPILFGVVLAGCGEVGFGTTPADENESPQAPSGPLPGDVDEATPRLFVGAEMACAIVSPELSCWGDPRRVVGSDEDEAVAQIDLGQGRVASSVAAGRYHACALLSSGQVMCWGDNARGQLGLGDTDSRDVGDGLDAVEALALGEPSIAVAVGTAHSCALSQSGQVRCWGASPSHGAGTTSDVGAAGGDPIVHLFPLALGGNAVAIAAGSGHTCALLESGDVRCWGENGDGQLGLGDTNPRGASAGDVGLDLPAVELGADAIAISAGGAVSCALLVGGGVKCWGSGDYGTLGTGDRNDRGDEPDELGALPPINLPRPAVSVHTSGRHACAMLDDDSLRCWGANRSGELGLGHTDDVGDTPGEMGPHLRPADLGTALPEQLGVGYERTCAYLDDATVRCWGHGIGDEPGEMGHALPTITL